MSDKMPGAYVLRMDMPEMKYSLEYERRSRSVPIFKDLNAQQADLRVEISTKM